MKMAALSGLEQKCSERVIYYSLHQEAVYYCKVKKLGLRLP